MIRVSLHAFGDWLGLGRTSRKGRRQRRLIIDLISRPARLHCKVAPRSGPPKGPPDRYGVRPYFTLEEARLGGVISGETRREKARKRNRSIRKDIYKRGLTQKAAADRAGVCVRTVQKALADKGYLKLPKHRPGHDYREDESNSVARGRERGAASDENRRDEPATAPTDATDGAGKGGGDGGAGGLGGQDAGVAMAKAVAPANPVRPANPAAGEAGFASGLPGEPPRPSFARSTVALKLHWAETIDQLLANAPDQRWRNIRESQQRKIRREINQYADQVRRKEGPERWAVMLSARREWLRELRRAVADPVMVLARHNRLARQRHQRNLRQPTKRETTRRKGKT